MFWTLYKWKYFVCIFCFFPLNIIFGKFMHGDTDVVHSFLPLYSLSLYDYSIVYSFIHWFVVLTKEIWAVSSDGFCCCFAVMVIYVSWSTFVETGYMVVCELRGFDICASSTLLGISVLFSYQHCINILALQQSL